MFEKKGSWNKTVFPNRFAKKFYSYIISHETLWKALLERLKWKKDAFVLITGKTGNGKSTLVGKMNFRFAEKQPNFILENGENMFVAEKHFIIDGDEFAYKMITEQGSSLWYDEAREGSNRQSWYDKVNKAIKQRKNTNRKLFNIHWFCMPLETEFDPKLAAHLTMWIWVKKRGKKGAIGEVYVADNQRKGGRGLDIDSIIKREEKWLKENPKKTAVPTIIHPEFRGRIIFSSFTIDEEKRYQELVKLKSATGKLTEEELEKFGLERTTSPEERVQQVIKKISNGEIKSKMEAWESLSDLDLTDEKKLKLLDRYCKLFDLGTFNRAFSNNKKNLSNLAERLKRINRETPPQNN